MNQMTNDQFLDAALNNINAFNEKQEQNRIEYLKKFEPEVVDCLLQASTDGQFSINMSLLYMINDSFLKEYPSIQIEFEGEATIPSPVSVSKKITTGYNYKFTIKIPE